MQPTIYDLQLGERDFSELRGQIEIVLNDDFQFPRKIRSKNFYKKLSLPLKTRVHDLVSKIRIARDLIWHFEIFCSYEPVGLHNDRNYFPKLNERCDMGLIIPIAWTGFVPATRFYDLRFEEKVNWNGVAFNSLDGIQFQHQASDLTKSQDLEWKQNTILFFDSRQIHDAKPFQKNQTDYKLSLNGLGYSNS